MSTGIERHKLGDTIVLEMKQGNNPPVVIGGTISDLDAPDNWVEILGFNYRFFLGHDAGNWRLVEGERPGFQKLRDASLQVILMGIEKQLKARNAHELLLNGIDATLNLTAQDRSAMRGVLLEALDLNPTL